MPAPARISWRLTLSAAISFAIVGLTWSRSAADEPAAPAAIKPTSEAVEFFEKRVRPLLVAHCQKCHGAEEQKGGLRLDSRAAILAGGDSGPAVVPGNIDEGLLLDAVAYGDLFQMPPSGKLPAAEIEALRQWVELGAPWPAEDAKAAGPKNAGFDLAERTKHWAFQGLVAHDPPPVKDVSWPASPIDHFILARLEAAGLSPALSADRTTLLRRLSFDLGGLPPTPAEVQAFQADDSPQAIERVVDRLLSSPHFGERWARHWLDLVRYAESRGHEFDYPIPNAYQYRDYVIRAFNRDLPYGEFVTEQVAGDLLEHPRLNPEQGFNESILGTGFWFLGEEVHSPVDIRSDETDRNDNKIDVFSKTFLGLTVACARCHDHKFDAISTKDYYALAGFLLSSGYRQAAFESLEPQRKIAHEVLAVREAARPKIATQVFAVAKPALERTAELLLAVRELILASPAGKLTADAASGGEKPLEQTTEAVAERRQRIDEVAQQHGLDAALLTAWLVEVQRAPQDPGSPLALWAMLCSAPKDASVANTLQAELQRGRQQQQQAEQALVAARIVLDYGNCGTADWLQDGFTFGLRPVRTGEFQLGLDPARPIARIFNRAAAFTQNPGFAPDPVGAERESGRLSWLQSGRTLRTPNFRLQTGKLYYLVSGSGYAYAAVDSHRMNNGPLHGALIREWKAGDRYQWIEQNLSAYVGHRLHIEFSPRPASELAAGESPQLAIAMIVEADHPPAPLERPHQALLQAISSDGSLSAESVAQAYQQVVLRAAERFSAQNYEASAAAQDDARLADWVFTRPELWSAADNTARQAVAEAARPAIESLAKLAASVPRQSALAPAMFDGAGVDECVLLRGNAKTPGETVPRRFLEAIAGAGQPPIQTGSGRLELARRMIDPRHPLLARVFVNRVWQHLFGRGIVASADNFGVLGEMPTHPELLDYLADDFVQSGWSIKPLIRKLVLTQTYQMSSRPSEQALQVDPRNLLWQHMPLKRLEAEAIRDAVLAVSGRLDDRMYGPSVPTYLTPFMDGRGRPASGPLDGDGRRSLYLSVRRNFMNTMFLAFDYPIPFTSAGRRSVSNVPAQALTMMNSPFVVAEAKRWAERALAEPAATPSERIDRLYLAAFSRQPTEAERTSALSFLAEQATRYGSQADDPRAWADLCHVLLNVKEFIFVR